MYRNLFSIFFKKKIEQEQEAEEDRYSIYHSKVDKKPIVLVTMLEIAPDEQEKIIEKCIRKYGKKQTLLFVVDDPDFSVLKRHSQMFEYFPSILQQSIHSDTMAWQTYISEKWLLLMTKWSPVKIVTFGSSIEHFTASTPS